MRGNAKPISNWFTGIRRRREGVMRINALMAESRTAVLPLN
jgi:hypothetical protein